MACSMFEAEQQLVLRRQRIDQGVEAAADNDTSPQVTGGPAMNVEPGVSAFDEYGRPGVGVMRTLFDASGGDPGCRPAHARRVAFARKNKRVVRARVLPRPELVLMFPGGDARQVLLCRQTEEFAPHYGADESAPQMRGQNRAHHAFINALAVTARMIEVVHLAS